MKTLKQKLLAAAVTASLIPLAAQADAINVNFYNDAVSVTGVAQFDWAASNVLALGGNQAFANFVNSGGTCPNSSCDFNVFAQGRLRGLADVNNLGIATPGLNTNYEVTFMLAFKETVTSASSQNGINTAFFQAVPGGTNYFNMYYDTSPDSLDLQGTGFDNGDLVYSGSVRPEGNFVSNFSATGSAATIGGANNGTTPGAWAGVQTVTGGGITTALQLAIVGGVTSPLGELFFGGYDITSFLMDNLSQNLRYTSVDPSLAFTNDLTNAPYNSLTGVGNFNGGTTGGFNPDGTFNPVVAIGPSIIFQTDPNGPISGTRIPEPGSLALMGLALAALGASKRKAKAMSV